MYLMHRFYHRHRFQLIIILVIISCIAVYNNIVGSRSSSSSRIHYDIIKNGDFGALTTQVDITQIRNSNTCLLIKSALNVTLWPDVKYYGDLSSHHYSSPKEEDVDRESRLAVQQFNQLRKLILTSKVLDAGYSHGGLYPARSFAKRLVDATSSAYTKSSSAQLHLKPLVIAVFVSRKLLSLLFHCSTSETYAHCFPYRETHLQLARIVGRVFMIQI